MDIDSRLSRPFLIGVTIITFLGKLFIDLILYLTSSFDSTPAIIFRVMASVMIMASLAHIFLRDAKKKTIRARRKFRTRLIFLN